MLGSFKINGVQVIKSGTDFREFSCITVNFNTDNSFTLDVQRIEITSDIPEDPEVKSTVDKYVGEFQFFVKSDLVLGSAQVHVIYRCIQDPILRWKGNTYLGLPFNRRAGNQANRLTVRTILPTWSDHLTESFSYKEVQLKKFGQPVKTSWSPAENVSETPAS